MEAAVAFAGRRAKLGDLQDEDASKGVPPMD